MADIGAVTTIAITARDDTKRGLDSVRGGLNELRNAAGGLQGVMAGLGATLSVAAFAAGIKAAIDYADQLNDLAKQTGIAVETLGGLGYAAQQSGTSLEAVAKGTSKLATLMADAAAGVARASSTFESMGVSVRNADGSLKSLDVGLAEIADKFAGYEDGAEKAALANALFGERLGAQMIPLLNEGGDKLREMVAEYQKYGGITADTAARADAFNDTLSKLAMIGGSLWRTLASALLPTLQAIANIFVEAKNKTGEFGAVADGVTVVVKGLATAGIAVVEVFRAVGASLGNVIGAIMAYLRGDSISSIWEGLKQGFGDVGASIGQAFDRAKDVIGASTATIASTVTTNIGKTRAPLVQAAADVGKLKDAFGDLQRQLLGKVASAAQLSEVERLQIKLTSDEYKNLTAAQREHLLGIAATIDALAEQKRAAEESNKAWVEAAKVMDDLRAAYDKAIASADQILEQLQNETAALTMTNKEREVALRLRELERAGIERGTDDWNRYAAAISDAVERKEALQSQIDLWKEIEGVAHDAFTNIMQSGKGAFDRLADALKNGLMALLYQMTVRPFIVNIAAAVSGNPGMVGALGGGGGDLLSSLFGGGSGGTGGGLGSIANLFGGVGGGLSGMLSGAAGSFATSGIGSALGLSAPVFGVEVAGALGLTGAGAGLVGLMGALGTALPYIGVALAIASAMGAFDRGGPKQGGFAGTPGLNLGSAFAGDDNRYFTPNNADADLQTIVDKTSTTFDSLFARLGGQGSGGFGFGLGYDTDPEGDANNRLHVGSFVNGKQVYDYQSGDDALGTDPEALQAAIELETKRAMLAGLQASDLPDAIKTILNSVTAATASSEDIDNITRFAEAFKGLTDFLGNADPVLDAQKMLEDAQKSSVQRLIDTATELRKMGDGFDGTADSLTALGKATAEYYSNLVKALAQIQQIKDSLHGLLSDTSTDLRLSVMSDEERRKYYQDHAAMLRDQLATASSPEEVQRLAEQINNDIRAAWGLLTPEQQGQALQEQLRLIDEIQQEADSRLDDIATTLEESGKETLEDMKAMLGDFVAELKAGNIIVKAAADSNADAAKVQLQAANINMRAATTPVRIEIEQPTLS